jgi:hypothetical protein
MAGAKPELRSCGVGVLLAVFFWPTHANPHTLLRIFLLMIRKLKSGEFRLYSRKKNPKSGKRRNLGTFSSLAAAKKHERAVQFFKRA